MIGLIYLKDNESRLWCSNKYSLSDATLPIHWQTARMSNFRLNTLERSKSQGLNIEFNSVESNGESEMIDSSDEWQLWGAQEKSKSSGWIGNGGFLPRVVIGTHPHPNKYAKVFYLAVLFISCVGTLGRMWRSGLGVMCRVCPGWSDRYPDSM